MAHGLSNPKSDTPRWKTFSTLAAALTAYDAIVAALGNGAYVDGLPLRAPYQTDVRPIVAHPTSVEWAIPYDAISEAVTSQTGLVSSLSGYDATRTHRDVFLDFRGQSNVLGQGASPTPAAAWTDNTVQSQWRYWAEDGNSYFSGAGTATPSGSTNGGFVDMALYTAGGSRFSPALPCARILTKAGFNVATHLSGQGSTTLAANGTTFPTSDWHPTLPGSKNLYAVSKSEGEAALVQALANDLIDSSNYRIVSVWIQGETDAASAARAAIYEASGLNPLHDALEADWAAAAPGVPWHMIVIQLDSACTATATTTVRSEQAASATTNPTTMTLIDPSSIGLGVGDGLHRDPDDNIAVGRLIAEAIAAL